MDLFATQDNSQLPQCLSVSRPLGSGLRCAQGYQSPFGPFKRTKNVLLCPFERTFQKDKKDFQKDILNMHICHFKTYSSDYHCSCKHF